MWFKLSLLVLVCVMMVVLNFGGMHPCMHRPASKLSNIVQVVDQNRENTTRVSLSLF
jgi:fatty acid desaturase